MFGTCRRQAYERAHQPQGVRQAMRLWSLGTARPLAGKDQHWLSELHGRECFLQRQPRTPLTPPTRSFRRSSSSLFLSPRATTLLSLNLPTLARTNQGRIPRRANLVHGLVGRLVPRPLHHRVRDRSLPLPTRDVLERLCPTHRHRPWRPARPPAPVQRDGAGFRRQVLEEGRE